MLLLAGSLIHAQRRGRLGSGASRYGWRQSYSQAKAEAKKTGKPIMLVFRCVP